MRIQEDAAIITLADQKETFKSACREEWRDAYIAWIHRRISEKVSDAFDFIDSLPDRSPSSWDEDTVEEIHSRRRIIAGYRQEAELCCFSEEIYGQVEQDVMYILKGAWYVACMFILSTCSEATTSASTCCSSSERTASKSCIPLLYWFLEYAYALFPCFATCACAHLTSVRHATQVAATSSL